MIRFAGVLAFVLCVVGQANAGSCIDAAGPKAHVATHNGKWTILTNDQRLFLAGIYAMNPQTPPGLPFGDGAALIQTEGQDGGTVIFLDGDKACTPMPVPKELIEMLMNLSEVRHEGSGT